jgi:hypothetical protein
VKYLVKMAQGNEGENVQEFKSNAQISLKYVLEPEAQPPKTKSLEPTNSMVW